MIKKLFSLTVTTVLCIAWVSGADNGANDSKHRVPVTSHVLDVGDDPEYDYVKAPRFDWNFFGGQMRFVEKSGGLGIKEVMGIAGPVSLMEMGNLNTDGKSWQEKLCAEHPEIKFLIFGKLGKIIYSDGNERPRAHAPKIISEFMQRNPNALYGGGQIAEFDTIWAWGGYKNWYQGKTHGKHDLEMPLVWHDMLESHLTRSGAPYLIFEFNKDYAMFPSAKERTLSFGKSQLFCRDDQAITPSLIALRSASRNYFYPYGVQFSGTAAINITNKKEALGGAKPEFIYPENDWHHYNKSWALNRQVYYLSWLNGARFYMVEGHAWAGGEPKDIKYPSPFLSFVKKSGKLMAAIKPGPVQTPIAIMSEADYTWLTPGISQASNKGGKINWNTFYGGYQAPDYQKNGIHEFFINHYLHRDTMFSLEEVERFAINDTPYGECWDFLQSDARDTAMSRYGLVIWAGVPPFAPAMVRDKLLKYIDTHNGRVILFGATAKKMFPEWFLAKNADTIAANAQVTYKGQTFTEEQAFTIETLKNSGSGLPGLKILATVNGKPLAVECGRGLVLILSSDGINSEPVCDPQNNKWKPSTDITEIPHDLLSHVKKILHDEVMENTLFTVGSSELHYVVTRPQKGEYLLGLLNDKMTSEPFKIQSHIGPITKIEEIELNDGLDLLKSTAKGAGYAPAKYRQQPDTLLPIDYGLNDDAHIEGRNFRLFRIEVEEQGIREVTDFKFAHRPTGYVLAMEKIGHIRHKIQTVSMFFSWFDGVKVDGPSFLMEDDRWLVYQSQYISRRGIRIVVDGTTLNEAQIVMALKKLPKAGTGPKDLITGNTSPKIKQIADEAGVRLVNPATIHRLRTAADRFKKESMLNVVELFYANEDDIWLDVKQFTNGTSVGALRGTGNNAEMYSAPEEIVDNYCYIQRDVEDLASWLEVRGKQLGSCKGLIIDSEYLRKRTPQGLAIDQKALKKQGLKLIVDLRVDQVPFEGISYETWQHNYEDGLSRYEEIVSKMPDIGAKDLILNGGKKVKSEKVDEERRKRDAQMNHFADSAKKFGVNLHFKLEDGMKFSELNPLDKENVFVLSEGNQHKVSPYARLNFVTGDHDNIEVRASSMGSGWSPARVIDGNVGTRWISKGLDNQWLSINYKKEKTIRGLTITWENAGGKVYDVLAKVDNTYEKVATIEDGKAGEKRVIKFDKPVTTSQIKLDLKTRATQWGFSIYEIELMP